MEPSDESKPQENDEINDTDLSETQSLYSNSNSIAHLLTKLAPNECFAANFQCFCQTDQNNLIITNTDTNQTKTVSFQHKIKHLIIAKAGYYLVCLTENDGFHIIDLELGKEMLDIGKFHSPKNIKWHPRIQGFLAVNHEGVSIEILSKVEQTFKSTIFEIKDVTAFDLGSGPNLEIGYVTAEGVLKICDLYSNSEQIISNSTFEDVNDVIFIDRDTISVISSSNVTICARSPAFEQVTYEKSVFLYDQLSDIGLFADIGSSQVTLFTKESIISQKYDETLDLALKANLNQIDIVYKDAAKRSIEIIAIHEDEVYKYPIIFSPESDVEEKELEVPEIKEEIKIPEKQEEQKSLGNKRKDKKAKSPGKKNPKNKAPTEISEFKPPEPPKPVAPPKDMVTPIISCLNKRFDDLMRRLETTLSEKTLSQVISKHLQVSYDGRGQDQVSALKNALQSFVFQAFGNEFRTVLIPIFERDINENFKNMFFLLQETLRQSAERNTREEAKSQSLNAHMKNTVEGLNNLSKKLGKVAFKQLKRVEELEVVLVEKAAAVQPSTSSVQMPKVDSYISKLKQEIEQYLYNQEFEKAITRLLRENNPSYLFKVLTVCDPRPLIDRDYLSPTTISELFNLLVTCVEQNKEFSDIFLWLEELCKKLPTGSSDLSRILARLCEACDRNPKLRNIMKLYTSRLR